MEKIKQKKLAAFMVDKAVVLRCKDYAHPDILKDIMSWSDEEAREVWEKIVKNIENGDTQAIIMCPYCVYTRQICEKCFFGIKHGVCEIDGNDLWSSIEEKLKNNMTEKWYQDTIDSINNLFMEVESRG